MILFSVYFIFTLDYGNDVRQKSIFEWFSSLSSKCFIKQRGQLATPTTHLDQELLKNVQCGGGSRNFAKETRALKMRSVCRWKLTMTIESHHRSWSSYNYTRSCWRTQCQPFYSHLASEANWKGGKSWSVDPHDPNGRKQRGTKEPPDEGERGEWKSWLKTQHSKTKIMASGPITPWQIDGKQ